MYMKVTHSGYRRRTYLLLQDQFITAITLDTYADSQNRALPHE